MILKPKSDVVAFLILVILSRLPYQLDRKLGQMDIIMITNSPHGYNIDHNLDHV